MLPWTSQDGAWMRLLVIRLWVSWWVVGVDPVIRRVLTGRIPCYGPRAATGQIVWPPALSVHHTRAY